MFSRVCWKFPLKICPHDIALFLFFESRQVELSGNGELLELRLLETSFLSRFQLNP